MRWGGNLGICRRKINNKKFNHLKMEDQKEGIDQKKMEKRILLALRILLGVALLVLGGLAILNAI